MDSTAQRVLRRPARARAADTQTPPALNRRPAVPAAPWVMRAQWERLSLCRALLAALELDEAKRAESALGLAQKAIIASRVAQATRLVFVVRDRLFRTSFRALLAI